RTNPIPNGGTGAPTRTWTVTEAPEETKVELGSTPDLVAGKAAVPPLYRMHLELSNVGASIESATLTDPAAKIASDARYALLSPVNNPSGGKIRSFEIEKIHVDGEDVQLRGKRWEAGKLQRVTLTDGGEGEAVEFHVDLNKAGAKAIRLTRT